MVDLLKEMGVGPAILLIVALGVSVLKSLMKVQAKGVDRPLSESTKARGLVEKLEVVGTLVIACTVFLFALAVTGQDFWTYMITLGGALVFMVLLFVYHRWIMRYAVNNPD